MQISINYMLKNVDVNEIEEIWAIRTITGTKFCHFIGLLSDKTYVCSCLGLVNRGIICRHFFQVMLYSPTAAFHIMHIHKRWYNNIHSNLRKEPYIVATRFSKNDPQYPLKKDDINERKLYGELWRVARDITQKAIRFHRQDVLKKLQDLLTEIQEDELISNPTNNNNEETCSNSNNNLDNNNDDGSNDNNDDGNDDDKENYSLAGVSLQNPKKRKAKGHPKSSKRIK
ncbi:hypothetical protein C2G38_2282702 [Gigaspora rosea]|uniref:SWIM-type domain-containing protein n=1 Tax=Gigaspora rosea TaxID=44941 RepID=A0A397W7N5_9GLOM|nr:hypothetical protein C2G38_2282702 [Gigaspora rosea]